MSAAMMTVRETLREATRTEHARVDALPRMRALLSQRVTRATYVEALSRLYRVHCELDAAIDPALGRMAHSTLRPAQLLDGLEQDLAQLGREALPEATAVTPLAAPAQALGAWYVLEGAALGGVLLARHLRSVLGDDLPLAHFGGPRARRRWPDFLRHLEAQLRSAQLRSEAIAGARCAYDRSRQILG